MIRTRCLVLGSTLAALVGLPAGVAGAHVEPTDTSAPAGSRTVIGFAPDHGCGDSPITRVAVQLAPEVTEPEPVDLPGWSASVSRAVARADGFESVVIGVTWTGGTLSTFDETTFAVEVTLPDTPGATLYFPAVQTCEDGAEEAYVQRPGDGSDQERLAPAIALTGTGPGDTTTTLAPVGSTTVAPTTTSTTVPVTTTAVVTTTTSVPDDDDGGTSVVPFIIAGVAAVALAAGAYAVGVRRR